MEEILVRSFRNKVTGSLSSSRTDGLRVIQVLHRSNDVKFASSYFSIMMNRRQQVLQACLLYYGSK